MKSFSFSSSNPLRHLKVQRTKKKTESLTTHTPTHIINPIPHSRHIFYKINLFSSSCCIVEMHNVANTICFWLQICGAVCWRAALQHPDNKTSSWRRLFYICCTVAIMKPLMWLPETVSPDHHTLWPIFHFTQLSYTLRCWTKIAGGDAHTVQLVVALAQFKGPLLYCMMDLNFEITRQLTHASWQCAESSLEWNIPLIQ